MNVADDADTARRRVVHEPVEPVVGDVGVGLEDHHVAVAVQRECPVDRCGEALPRRLLDQRRAAAFSRSSRRYRASSASGVASLTTTSSNGVRHVGREHALDAAPRGLEIAIDRDDDVDGGHQRDPPSRRFSAAKGKRSQPRDGLAIGEPRPRLRVGVGFARAGLRRALARCLRFGQRRFQRGDAIRQRDGRVLFARQRIDGGHQLGQPVLRDGARVEFIPRQLAFAAERTRIVAPQRERAIVEQRKRRAAPAAARRPPRTRRRSTWAAPARARRSPRCRASARNCDACRARPFGPERGLRDHALRVPGLLRKRGIEQRLQFGAVEFAHVEVVLDLRPPRCRRAGWATRSRARRRAPARGGIPRAFRAAPADARSSRTRRRRRRCASGSGSCRDRALDEARFCRG